MSRFGDGLAEGPDPAAAAEAAASSAFAHLDGRAADLVFVFVSADDPEAVAAAGEQVSRLAGAGSTVVGCSAAGVLGAGRGVEGAGAVSVFAAVLPGVSVRSFHLEVMRAEAGMAIVGLPETRGEPEDDEVAVLLVDPHTFPAGGFLGQANRALPGLPIVGGLATGPGGPGSVRLFLDGRTVDRGAVGVVLDGALARPLLSQGCRAVGPPMTVTATSGGVVLGLAGEPALQRVERLLGDLLPVEQALASTGLQLGVAVDEYAEEADYVVRAILGTDRTTGGLRVAEQVQVGQTVRLQVLDADAADAGLTSALAAHRLAGPPGGVLVFSCLGRGAGLFGASYGGADHDPAVVRRELGGPAVAGFFGDGEIGPVAGQNHLHGFTASMLAFPS